MNSQRENIMSLIFNKFNLTDTRDGKVFSEPPYVCYTLPGEDIYASRPDFSAFSEKEDREFLVGSLSQRSRGDGINFTLRRNTHTDGFGIVLPFDFMGKRDGIGKVRYLLNSVRHDRESGVFYAYLCRADGKNILVCAENIAGWKTDYSSYDYGHYFEAIRLYASLPEALGKYPKSDVLSFSIYPVTDFGSCLNILSKHFSLPFICGDTLSGKVGESLQLKAFGKCDSLEIKFGNCIKYIPYDGTYTIENEGVTKITPICGTMRGAAVTVLGISDTVDLYKKVMNAFSFETLSHVDGNLCEHQCWMSAMLRFLIKYPRRVSAKEKADWEEKLKAGLSPVTAEDPGDFIVDRTILPFDYDGFSKYHIYSGRIQEQFFGVTILLDAYRYFGEEKYLTYASGALDCLLDEHFEGGMLYRTSESEKSDVTTVCCPMIPICDMANFMREREPERAAKYYAAAGEMAEFLLRRGFDFPTEGESASESFKAEDGSVSCTALALLYYVKNVKYDEKYLSFAKEILDFHSTSWVINTPLCEALGSTLRWWETIWEGDSDGPAVCAGHAWTVWRAEADMLYYQLTGEKEYLTRAKNGFASNMAKIDSDGTSYAISIIDEICGGGADRKKAESLPTPRKPKTPDCGLSNYLWVRLSEYLKF